MYPFLFWSGPTESKYNHKPNLSLKSQPAELTLIAHTEVFPSRKVPF